MFIETLFIVLSFVVFTLIENYYCIDYLSCKSKTLCDISNNKNFKENSLNLLLGVGIPELLLKLLSCNEFMLKSNSTVILNCRSRRINNYLSKGFSIINRGSKQLKLIPNDLILRINIVDQLKTDYFMVKNDTLSAIANTIKPLHIHENMHMTYKQDFYKTKDKEIYDLLLEHLAPVMKDLEHPALIK